MSLPDLRVDHRVDGMAGPDTLYRGTSEERFDDRYGGDATIPENWTDDPLEAFSFAMTFAIDKPEKDPLILATPYDDGRFDRSQPSVHSDYMFDVPVGDHDATWYTWTGDEPATPRERDSWMQRYTAGEMDEFVSRELADVSDAQVDAVRSTVAVLL